MSVFKDYASYYDLLYQDKDYEAEADYVIGLIQKYAPHACSVLELGCGTGKYGVILARNGYDVTGIDFSKEMITIAQNKLLQIRIPNIVFSTGDIRSIRLKRNFDLVAALFHVISYQITNDDILATLNTAREHLKEGGIFIFDCWYGPAVLTEKPSVRMKTIENEHIKVMRFAEPIVHAHDNVVDVNYTMVVKDKSNNTVDEIKETHSMRYLFKPELDMMFKSAGLRLVAFEEWLSGTKPSINSWNVTFIVSLL
jgi:SAM-dependent methyltransferase